jgi:DNA-binding transcriptional ArsR family regulator
MPILKLRFVSGSPSVPLKRAQAPAGAQPGTHRHAWATAVAKALSHPVRVEILRVVAASGPISPSTIATEISQDLPKLAYHVRELAALGLLDGTRDRQVRGVIEHFYDLTADGEAVIEAIELVLRLDPRAGRRDSVDPR